MQSENDFIFCLNGGRDLIFDLFEAVIYSNGVILKAQFSARLDYRLNVYANMLIEHSTYCMNGLPVKYIGPRLY